MTDTDHDAIIRLEEQVLALRQARDLQAREYERRLESLNHEAARIAASAEIYAREDVIVPKIDNVGALLAASRADIEEKLAVVTQRLTLAEAKTTANRALFVAVTGVLGLVIAILGIVASKV